MPKFRLAILGVGAALVLGTASAFAMATGTDTARDSHGDQVSAAAQSDTTTGPASDESNVQAGTTDNDAHGNAVSAVAMSDATATCTHGPTASPETVTNHGCAVSTVAKGTH
jgi:hypothetical protein